MKKKQINGHYKEHTKMMSFRVPISKIADVRQLVNKYLAKFKNKA